MGTASTETSFHLNNKFLENARDFVVFAQLGKKNWKKEKKEGSDFLRSKCMSSF